MDEKRGTAPYRIIADAGGNRYRFYCESSGMAVCTTAPIHSKSAGSPQELLLAWESEGRQHFNRCQKCGKWVSDVMYNVDALQCVDCSPWEDPPLYCSRCGARLSQDGGRCPKCGVDRSAKGGEDD